MGAVSAGGLRPSSVLARESYGRAAPRRASPRVYRLLLATHIIVSVGWLGIVFAKLVLGLRAMTSNAPASPTLYICPWEW
jgi:hypothetical protein